MSTYKRLPREKKKFNLPLYRPIDRLFVGFWQMRNSLIPFAIALGVIGSLYGGFYFYQSRYESQASLIYQKGDLLGTVREYPRSEAALLARLKLGLTALREKRWNDAIGWYQPISEGSKGEPVLRIAATQNLALAYLNKGEGPQATTLLEKTIRNPENVSSDYTRLLLAHTYEVNGGKEKATEIYKSLSEGAESASIQQEAKAKLEGEKKP